ncbi:Serine/threonine-protein kinase TOUSLED-like protein [Drosera capensis]
MGDEIFVHFNSNSSNQSDQSEKMAKLRARMEKKDLGSSTVAVTPPVQQVVRFSGVEAEKAGGGRVEGSMESLSSSDSDDDVNVGGFLIQANTQKRQKMQEGDGSKVEHIEVTTDGNTMDSMTSKSGSDVSRRKQGHGRGVTSSSRGRASKVNDPIIYASVSSSNGHLENSSDKEEIALLRAKISALEEELRKSRMEATENKHISDQYEKELKDLKDREHQLNSKMYWPEFNLQAKLVLNACVMQRTKVISDLLISVSKAEREEARMNVRQDSLRLGNVGVIRAGSVLSETWEEGKTLKDINSNLRQLLEAKETVERRRKTLRKRQSDRSDEGDVESSQQEEDFAQEVYKSRLASIKREEEILMRERDRYEFEKGRLIREMKRIRDEDGSRFNNFPILNHRYALLNLLGRGGFCEVYKAYDLMDYKYVACKLHGLNQQWAEEKKKSYMRHAIREYNIHKTLVHNNIVRLWDTFEIDQNTFCTVLEYCSGKDLDAVLKTTPSLPEKEARIIIAQIFQGLVYLNKRAQKVIHYDLKPGNVLFDEVGVAKLTDFGLSKIVEEDVGSRGMELTSQGAGTYWYLPPECFELNKTPMISSKVDVWSAGILFYQMLFGRRPFGHDQTQERILREDTIIKARKVDFPSRPTVSNEAKELIRRCLTYNQAERPDVLTIALDLYLSYAKK